MRDPDYCDHCSGDLEGGCEHDFCPDCLSFCLDCEIDHFDAQAELDRDYLMENH